MRPPTSYTCNRCLNAIKTTPRTTQSLSTKLTLGRRDFSTNPKNVFKPAYSKRGALISSELAAGKRSVSSVGHAREAQNDGHEIDQTRSLLKPNNLFHPMSSSPSPDMRKRAAFIKQNAYCPHPDHRQTRMPMNPNDPEARKTGAVPPKHVSYECPDCGVPVSCSEEHWADDYEAHLEICDTLREINEDDHDLRSGRFFPEFEYPGENIEEAMVNMTNWDTFLFTREFEALNNDRSLRQATRLLTYPVTIGSVLHELSPYNIKKGGRLTVEGLKSLSGMSSIGCEHASTKESSS